MNRRTFAKSVLASLIGWVVLPKVSKPSLESKVDDNFQRSEGSLTDANNTGFYPSNAWIGWDWAVNRKSNSIILVMVNRGEEVAYE